MSEQGIPTQGGAAPPDDPHARIDELLDQLVATASPQVAATAQELVRAVLALHREGLGRLVAGVDRSVLVELADDPSVDGLLVLHDLHPLDLPTRAAHAVRRLHETAPALALELVGVEASGTVHVRLSVAAGSAGVVPEVEERLLAALPDAASV
jgi:hypothetical protein